MRTLPTNYQRRGTSPDLSYSDPALAGAADQLQHRSEPGRSGDPPFVFAGLWEGWKDPSTSEWLHTCTIITGEPNELVVEVHTRMPVILPEEHHAKWLGEAQDGDLKELLKPFPAERMKMWPISSRVNSPENDDEAILESIEHDP